MKLVNSQICITIHKEHLSVCLASKKANYGRFLERKIRNPLAYLADMLKKLSGSEQLYLTNVKIVLM